METDKSGGIIGLIVVILSSINALVFSITGWSPFQEGQILIVVNGVATAIVVGWAWWHKYQNSKLKLENAELKTALIALSKGK